MKQSNSPSGDQARQEMCPAKRANGMPCKARATKSGYCFFHDPDHSEAQRIARIKGAFSIKSMKIQLGPEAEWKDMPLEVVRKLISELLRRLSSGELVHSDPIGKISYLANVRMGLENATNLEKRLEKLEEAVNGKAAK